MEFLTVKLENIADVIMGQSPPSEYYNEEGKGLPFFQGKTEFGEYYPIIKQYSEKGTKIGKIGDILFTVRAPVGELNIANTKCIIGRGLASICSKENDEQKFLYYALKVFKPAFTSRSYGAVYDAINRRDLFSTKMILPKNNTDRIKIGNILYAFDNLINNNIQRIKLLKELARIIFYEFFTLYLNYPKGINEKTLGSLIIYNIGGGWGEESKSNGFSEPSFVIRGTDIDELPYGNIDGVPFRYHKKSNLASRKLQDGDIIFEVSGGSHNEGVAKTLLITSELLNQFDNDVMCASFCKLARPIKRELSYFLFLFLQFLREVKGTEVFEIRSASNIVNYNWTAFLKFQKVKLPDDKTLEKFNEIIDPIYKQIYNLGHQNQLLKEARDILLPRLMTGMIEL